MELLREEYPKESLCLNCGSPLYGRSDKKYCSTVCKDQYNYRLHSSQRKLQRRVLVNINVNYSILCGIIEKGITKAPIADLEGIGFKPAFLTGICRTGSKGVFEMRCYDIRYLMSETNIYGIRYTCVNSSHLE